MVDVFSKASTKAALVKFLNIDVKALYGLIIITMVPSILLHWSAIFLALPLWAICRTITEHDDQAFRILWLWFKRRILALDVNVIYWGSMRYSKFPSRRSRFHRQ